jgi:hypothetical protein
MELAIARSIEDQVVYRHNEQNVANILLHMNFHRINIVGDGNCLFRSISFLMFGTQDFHVDLRNQTIDYITKNPQNFPHMTPDDIRQYCEGMSRLAVWGDETAIYALALRLKCKITVILTNGTLKVYNKIAQETQERDFVLINHQNVHFDVALQESV